MYFADAFPDTVAGMVYIDPQDPRISRAEMLLTDDEAEMDRRDAAYAAAVAALAGSGPPAPALEAEGRARARFHTVEPGDRDVPDDPAIPTAIVLTTRTPDLTGAPYYINTEWFREYHRVRMGRFVDWSLGRQDTLLILTSDSGHFVHLDRPDLVTAGVEYVLAQVP